jgi:hypothetical protein
MPKNEPAFERQSLVYVGPPAFVKGDVDNPVVQFHQDMQGRRFAGNPVRLFAKECVAARACRQCGRNIAPTPAIVGDDGVDDLACFAFKKLEPPLFTDAVNDYHANLFDDLAIRFFRLNRRSTLLLKVCHIAPRHGSDARYFNLNVQGLA